MDRNAMLEALAAAGVDVAIITDAVSDELLMQLVAAIQGGAAAPDASAAAGTDMMAAGAGAANAASAADQTTTPNPGLATQVPIARPVATVAPGANAAASRFPKTIKATFAEATRQMDATFALVRQQSDEVKRRTVQEFCETQVKEGRLTPADVECDPKTGVPLPHTTKARLLRADHVNRTHTFAEAGRTVHATELDLQMDEIRRRSPLVFSERLRQTPSQEQKSEHDAVRDQAKAWAAKRNQMGKRAG